MCTVEKKIFWLNQIDKITQKPFVRNVAVVTMGTAGAQAITMAFAPIITRIYGPEAFGLLGAFMAIVHITTPLAALSYPIAIVLPGDDADAMGLTQLSLMIALAMTASVTFVLLFFGEQISKLLNLNAIESFLMLIPVAMISSVGLAVMSQWVIRKQLFKIKARVHVVYALLLNGALAGVGLVKPVAAVLVVLASLGALVHTAMLFVGLRRETSGSSTQKHRAAPLKMLAKRHLDFPLYRTPQVLFNAASQSLPLIMLASFFGPAAAGFYALSRSVLALPTALIGKSVADVFYPRINRAVLSKEKATRLISKATLALLITGFLPFALIVAFGPSLFSLVFGKDWSMAGEYGRWLAIWLYFGFTNRPSVSAMPVLDLQGFFLRYEILSVLARILALFSGFMLFESDLLAVGLFSVTGALLNIFLILVTLHHARRIDTQQAETL